MTDYEKSTIIGLYRQGNSYQLIGWIMGISENYVGIIIKEYFNNKKQKQ